MNPIDDILADSGFLKAKQIQGRATVADLFRPRNRCGIYVLHFSNGDYYVGQAVDVTRRYIQHRKNHQDIEKISFKRLRKDKASLDEEERAAIRLLEAKGCRVRNIQLASMPYGESDFDLIMSPEEQERWLNDLSFQDLAGDRLVDSDLRRKYTKRFAQFEQMPVASEVIRVLREYVRSSVPAIRRGEVSFWACSCLPQSRLGKPGVIYSRVNVGWQTTFQATHFLDETETFYSWYLTKSLFEEARGERGWWDSFLKRVTPYRSYHGTITLVELSPLVVGGQDQIIVSAWGSSAALKLIEDSALLYVVRRFNRNLAKKGPCVFGRYHCLNLADRLIE